MMGQWALYHEGWLLSTKVNRAPWQAFGPANPDPLNNQEFQLYDLTKDFTQSNDIAADHPEKVAEMRKMFLAEAEKYQVLPLDASVASRIVAPRPNITAGHKEFVYTRPTVGLPQGDSPFLLNSSFTVTATSRYREGGASTAAPPDALRNTASSCWKRKSVSARNLSIRDRTGRPRAHAGPAHGRIRLQVRRSGDRHARVQQLQWCRTSQKEPVR